MAKQRARSGGGINSSVVTRKREATREAPRIRAANPAATADLGSAKGNHSENRDLPYTTRPLYSGNGYPTKLGNELATNVGRGGPGTGRTVMKAGSQSPTPAVSARPSGRGIN